MKDHIEQLRTIAQELEGKADPATLSEALRKVATAVADALEAFEPGEA